MLLLLAFAQLGLCCLVFERCASAEEPTARRWKFWFLAFALMCFGAWNFLAALAPVSAMHAEWMRQAGHAALLAFGALYLRGTVHLPRSNP